MVERHPQLLVELLVSLVLLTVELVLLTVELLDSLERRLWPCWRSCSSRWRC